MYSIYKYDEAGQLAKEFTKDSFAEDTYCVIKYSYNSGGNLDKKQIYLGSVYNEETDTYTAGTLDKTVNYGFENSEWTDVMTSYNGQNIEYDAMGNPLNYHATNYSAGDNFHFYNYENISGALKWEGRNLTEFVNEGSRNETDYNEPNKYVYTYNSDGLRTKKVRYESTGYPNYKIGAVTEYSWEDGVLKSYSVKSDSNNIDYRIIPLYNEKNEVMGISIFDKNTEISHGEETGIPANDVFYFVKDAQGNIVEAYSKISNCRVMFTYDAYGNLIDFKVDNRQYSYVCDEFNKPYNPNNIQESLNHALAGFAIDLINSVYKHIMIFTYRGYMYDMETGMYYNQSRYYSPEWGRFINADDAMLTDTGTGTTNANNMFAYCENDPINSIDPTGMYSIKRSTLATLLDVFLDIFAPQVAGPMDIVGRSIKAIFSGTKTYAKVAKVITKLKSGVIPQFKGLFTKFFTGIRKAIWRATGYTISASFGNAITSTLSHFVNILTNSRFSAQVDIIICMFSIGGWIALLVDMTDGSFNSSCKLW